MTRHAVNEGGSWFPTTADLPAHQGATVRDALAQAVLPALVIRGALTLTRPSHEDLAREAYALADAMVALRLEAALANQGAPPAPPPRETDRWDLDLDGPPRLTLADPEDPDGRG